MVHNDYKIYLKFIDFGNAAEIKSSTNANKSEDILGIYNVKTQVSRYIFVMFFRIDGKILQSFLKI